MRIKRPENGVFLNFCHVDHNVMCLGAKAFMFSVSRVLISSGDGVNWIQIK